MVYIFIPPFFLNNLSWLFMATKMLCVCVRAQAPLKLPTKQTVAGFGLWAGSWLTSDAEQRAATDKIMADKENNGPILLRDSEVNGSQLYLQETHYLGCAGR